jgi:chromosome segregation ATPase
MSENDILKSLADLEQNLKNIDSAKEQVSHVVTSTEALAQAIRSYEQSLSLISSNIKNLIGDNNTFYSEKLKYLSEEIERLQNEITRLVELDFNETFADLQKQAIQQFEKDLAGRLIMFDEKILHIQKTTDELKEQIDRLGEIDLEKHFDKHQKILSEIFGAINTINITLSSITQTLISLTQSLGTIQLKIDTQFAYIDEQFKEIKKKNMILQKEIKINRRIQLIGVIVLLTSISALLFLQVYPT